MSRRWAPAAAVVAVVAVVAAVSLVVRQRDGGGDPPVLRLAAADAVATSVAAGAPRGASESTRAGSFILGGVLPSGPATARAQLLDRGAAAPEEVRRLAEALGLTGRPQRVEGAWQVGALRVADAAGHPWSMSTASCGPEVPVTSDGPRSGCATVAGPAGAGPAIDVAAARRAAAGVLAALGQQDADIDVESSGANALVRADPRVDGLPTAGYPTVLDVDAAGSVVSASGYLGRPTAGPAYPLVSARVAFDSLPEQPRALMLCPENANCPQPAPGVVTGARLGLTLTALADDSAALLPAWLFTVKDWPMPLAQPAIEPRFLAPPPTGPPGDRPGDQPTQVDPAPANGPRSPFGFDSVFPTDDPKSLVVQYGDSGSCPHTNVTHSVKESAESVLVLLEGDTQPAGQACTSDYRQVLVTVRLQSALGKRTVIDGSRGTPVPVDRSCSRPMGGPPVPKDTAC